MNVPNLKRMTAEEYALWAERQETGRFELVDGMVVQMNAETADHALTKLNVAIALKRALQAAGLVGQVFGDGMALRIADNTAHEPDALLRIGPKLPGRTVLVTDAVVVVEVLSRSTGPVDTGRKLTNYFQVESVQHYLVVDTTKSLVLHYVRGADGQPSMKSPISSGAIDLDPPGLTITLDEIFE